MFRIGSVPRLYASPYPSIRKQVQCQSYRVSATLYKGTEAAGTRATSKKPRAKNVTPPKSSNERYVDRKAKDQSPIVQELWTLNKYGRIGKRSVLPLGDKFRQNIVSESLCDDVITRLRPSLDKHVGCDIIDINPGVGIFSSKLHDVLKPRTHVLMEPDDELYLRWLQPHIDKDDPSYHLIPASGIIWDNLRKLEETGCLPDQHRLPVGHPDLFKPNNTLLVVANLGYYPPRIYNGFHSVSLLMVHQLITAIRTHSLFQGFGQVRMLLWMRDVEKKTFLPRCVAHRRKTTVENEMHCESIIEVAGSNDPVSNIRRDHNIDLHVASLVRDRMATAGIETPPERVGSIQKEALETAQTNFIEGESITQRGWVENLEKMEQAFKNGLFKEWRAEAEVNSQTTGRVRDMATDEFKFMDDIVPRQLKPIDALRTEEFLKMRSLRYRASARQTINSKKMAMTQEYNSIRDGFKQLRGDASAESGAARKALFEREAAWSDRLENSTPNLRAEVLNKVQDQTLFQQDPPVLLWDQRPYEPLIVKKEEFFPAEEMCLLDVTPKTPWPIFQKEKMSDYDYFEAIATGLFITPTQSIRAGLAALAPGAAEWVLPRCPSFTDLENGGQVDVDMLAVRTMNLTMWLELIEAWMSWPFAPSKAQMMARLGSQSANNDASVAEDLDEVDFGGRD